MTLNVGWLLEPSSHSARISSLAEYLVAEAGVGRLDPGVLPGRARLDVGGAGAGDEAPVAQGMGGETTPAPAGYPTLPDPTLIE